MLIGAARSVLSPRRVQVSVFIRYVSNLPRVDPNGYFGVHTDYGWFTIPRNNYATDWTIPQIHDKIKQKYPDIDKKPRTFSEIQAVIDEWSQDCKPSSRPKPTKISRLDQQKLDNLLLYKQQTKAIERTKTKSSKESTRIKLKAERRKKKDERVKDRAEYYKHVLEHGRVPENYDFSKISFTSAWNHYAAKYYNGDNGEDTKSKRANVAATWQGLSEEDKEAVRQEYIGLLKQGQAYERGKLVPLRSKIKRLRYSIPTVDT